MEFQVLCFVPGLPLFNERRAIPGTFVGSCMRYKEPFVARPKAFYSSCRNTTPTSASLNVSKERGESETCIPAPTTPLFTESTFGALGLEPDILDHLQTLGINTPTGIQSRGIPPVLGGADVILGAATGSGKTFAYLLPVVQQLKQAEQLRCEEDAPLRVARRPRALVLVPTRELAEQVERVARALSHVAKFRVIGALAGGSGSMRKLKERLNYPVDVLVATTGRLLQLLEERWIDIRFVKHVVIDEVDTLFDKGFDTELKKILWWCKGANSNVMNQPQFIAAGATHPRAAEEIYSHIFPSAKRINVDLHKAPRGLEQRFVYVKPNTKVQELTSFLNATKRDGALTGGRMMVFCNTIDSCRFVDHFLVESGYHTSCIHGDIPLERREKEYESFRNGDKPLLICTDMAARGLDNLKVDHVVLFDFPNSAVDYLHRAGRTARAGATGRVTSFVLKKDLRLARAIQRAGLHGYDALESARISREQDEARKQREKEAAAEREQMEQVKGKEGLRSEERGRRGAANRSQLRRSGSRVRGREAHVGRRRKGK